MKRDKGFMLLEVLVAISIVFMLIATVLPIHLLIQREMTVLKERRIVLLHLHDALQEQLYTSIENEQVTLETFKRRTVTLHFSSEADFVKGCANWLNVQNRKETYCLYGKKEW